ncbi:MAG: hypothetical protein ACRDYY_11825, partial [Acidimicrobiales bacterium]
TRLVRAASGRLGQPAAGALLVTSGAYLAYYWAVSLSNPHSTPGLVAAVNSAQADIAGWLTANARWLGLASGIAVIAVLAIAALADNPRRTTHPSFGDPKDTDGRKALPKAADRDLQPDVPKPVISPHDPRSSSGERDHAHR